MSGGFILLHRSVFEHELFRSSQFSDREAWIWLLCQASYEPHRIRYGNQLIMVGRGEVPTSYRRLQEAWGWGVHRVRGFLSLLEQDGMLTRKIETGFLIVTICNYGRFQDALRIAATAPATPAATRPATNRTKGITQGTQVSESNDSDSCAQSEPKPSKISGLSRLPFTDLPPEWAVWSVSQMGWSAEITADTWSAFRDYWQAKTGTTAKKSDWLAAWRNWCRKENIKTTQPVRQPKADWERHLEGVRI